MMKFPSVVRGLLLLCVAGFGLVTAAHAQPVPATDPVPRVAFPLTHSGNVTTIGPRTADAANAAKFSFGVASNGAIFANTTDRMPTPGGASIPIGVNGTIAKPNVAAAIGRFARKALPILSVGSALYDLGEELGFGLDNSSGTLQVTKAPSLPEGYDGYEYSQQNSSTLLGWKKTKQEACEAYAVRLTQQSMYYDYVCWNASSGVSGSTHYFQTRQYDRVTGNPSTPTDQIYIRRIDPSPPANDPVASSVEEFEDAISEKSGWPTSSALARTLVDALKSGEVADVEPVEVTGPATSPGPSSQTVDPVANETTVINITHHHTYAGAQVTTTTVTHSTTTNNTTQAVVRESTTTTSPVMPSRPAEEAAFEMPCGVPGKPACEVKVDETGTPEYDDSKFKLDPKLETDAQELRDLVSGDGDKTGLFTNWTNFFSLPAIRECEAIEMPEVMGMQVPDMNPCPAVSWLRGLMAWIWAVAGFLFCWSQVQAARN